MPAPDLHQIALRGVERSKSRRASAPKVKTGCQNCKSVIRGLIRRIKCDENRPGCQKCWTYGVVCSGYPTLVPRHPKINRVLMPKKQDSVLAEKPVLATVACSLQLERLSMKFKLSSLILDEFESRYYRFYIEETSIQIGGPHQSYLWARIVPQATENHAFIAHAVVALGALSKAQQEDDRSRRAYHQNYAFTKLAEALKAMRNILGRDEFEVRIALIACLLVFCFESLQGNQAGASRHAAGGVHLLEMWNRCQVPRHKSHISDSLDDDGHLYNAVACLDLQAMSCLGSRPHERHKHSRGEFTSLATAAAYGHMIMRNAFHFICEVSISSTKTAASKGLSYFSDKNLWWTVPLHKLSFPEDIKEKYQSHLEQIRIWQVAAAPVLSRFMMNPNSESFLQSKLIQIRSRLTVIVLAAYFSLDHRIYDDYIGDFREIANLSALVWNQVVLKRSQFIVESGMLPALLQVGFHCRDHAIRMQVIDMMYSGNGYREGIWDSFAIASICNWVRILEEEWMDDKGNIPAEMRATLARFDMDMQNQRVHVTVLQRSALEEKDSQLKSKFFTW
ncbi:NFX1-type zinc finger-containing 1 protein [Rutstroemia sp. NJR-2017a BBW]|nr:NFX1-type zinc finger-containing 1 protein [Rutstroemia sp. NJR-2017a BBW]